MKVGKIGMKIEKFWVALILLQMAFNGTLLSSALVSAAPVAPAAKTTAAKTAPAKSTDSKAVDAAKKPGTVPATKVTTKSARDYAKPGNKELMWKATGPNGATLFLLGTIHVFKPEYYPLPDEMEAAFKKSKALLVEIDISKDDPETTKALVLSRGVYGKGDNMSQHVSPEVMELLTKYCEKSGLPIAGISRMRPWMVAITITQQEIERLGYLSKSGIDRHLIDEANALKKKVIGLETEEFQLGVFAGLSEDLQEKMLKLTLVDMALLPQDANEMMRSWLNGDEKGLVEIMTKDVREHPELAPVDEKLLYERNITMAQKLEAYLKGPADDVYIVAVGSGHLAGPRSIIDLLKQKGYKIEQVTVGDKI